MKLPEPAPNWQNLIEKSFKKISSLTISEGMKDVVKKANGKYVYWDKFKYFKLPECLTHELAWAYLKVTRVTQFKDTPIKDKKENKFSYWIPDSILSDLHYIDQYAAGQILVDDPRVHAAERERYLVNSIMEEAIASSQLEGAATTRKKAKDMLRSGRKPENRAEKMILNNYITIKNIKKFIDKPLSIDLLSKIQATITKDTLDDPDTVGRFRNEHEDISVIDGRDGKVLHVPPPAHEINERMRVLCNYANELHDTEFSHPVIKAILLHFWLAYIHPYVDGNGRTARALFCWYMLKHKYWLIEYLSISRIILRAPGQYARAYLYSEMDDLDVTYFLRFNLKTIHLAIEALQSYLEKQQKELKETEQFIRKYPGLNHRQYEVLYHAVSHPDGIYTIKYLMNIYNIVYQTARTDLIELEKEGLLEQKKRGQEFYFIPVKHIHKKLRYLKK
ncbi:MAG: Fic family protein [bacterium]